MDQFTSCLGTFLRGRVLRDLPNPAKLTGDFERYGIWRQLRAALFRPIESQVSTSKRLAQKVDACLLKNCCLFWCKRGRLIFSPKFVSSGGFLEDEQLSPFVADSERFAGFQFFPRLRLFENPRRLRSPSSAASAFPCCWWADGRKLKPQPESPGV